MKSKTCEQDELYKPWLLSDVKFVFTLPSSCVVLINSATNHVCSSILSTDMSWNGSSWWVGHANRQMSKQISELRNRRIKLMNEALPRNLRHWILECETCCSQACPKGHLGSFGLKLQSCGPNLQYPRACNSWCVIC